MTEHVILDIEDQVRKPEANLKCLQVRTFSRAYKEAVWQEGPDTLIGVGAVVSTNYPEWLFDGLRIEAATEPESDERAFVVFSGDQMPVIVDNAGDKVEGSSLIKLGYAGVNLPYLILELGCGTYVIANVDEKTLIVNSAHLSDEFYLGDVRVEHWTLPQT